MCHGSSYDIAPARKVGHVTIQGFRSWDDWSFSFIETATGRHLGSIDVEVDHKNGEHQDPPPATPYFKQLVAELTTKFRAVSA